MADDLDRLTASLVAAFRAPSAALTNAPQIGYLLRQVQARFPTDYSGVLATIGLDQITAGYFLGRAKYSGATRNVGGLNE